MPSCNGSGPDLRAEILTGCAHDPGRELHLVGLSGKRIAAPPPYARVFVTALLIQRGRFVITRRAFALGLTSRHSPFWRSPLRAHRVCTREGPYEPLAS